MCATSAIEIALWDILGKYTNKSVSELFETNNAKSVPVYANTWSDIKQDDNNLIANVEEQMNKDYDSIKIYPLQESRHWRGSLNNQRSTKGCWPVKKYND